MVLKGNVRSFFTNDMIMLTLVAVNTVTIFIGGYFGTSRLFVWFDAFFTLLFLVEAIVKISVFGWDKYWKDGWNNANIVIITLGPK